MAADLGPRILELYSSLNYPSAPKFYAALRQRGYVLGKEDVDKFVRGVGARQVFAPRRPPAQKSGSIAVADLDARWFGDLIDNTAMPAPGGQKYVLVLQDVFSRKVFARALANKKPDTANLAIADILRENCKAPGSIKTNARPDFARLRAPSARLGFAWATTTQRTSTRTPRSTVPVRPVDRRCRGA